MVVDGGRGGVARSLCVMHWLDELRLTNVLGSDDCVAFFALCTPLSRRTSTSSII